MPRSLLLGFALLAPTACKTPGEVAQVRSAGDGTSSSAALSAALTADQTTPLAGDALAAAPAALRQVAAGEAGDDASIAALLSAFREAFRDCRFSGAETPLFQGVKAAVRAKAIATYKDLLAEFQDPSFSRVAESPVSPQWVKFAAYVQEMDCLGLGLADVWEGARSPQHRFYLRSPAEVETVATFFAQTAWSPRTPELPASDVAGSYLRSMTNGFEFVDFLDILVNFLPEAPMIHPRQNRPVWQIYDYDGVTNIDGWRSVQTKTASEAAPGLKEIYGIISKRGDAFAFRDSRVVGGGDLDPPPACATVGMASWLGNTKFFRAGRRQVAVMRRNRLLATQWCEDGGTDPDAGVIAQYEYPSAQTYAFPVAASAAGPVGSQPARFAAMLSPSLRASLDQAKAAGKLARQDTPEFKALTRAIIEELVASILKDWQGAKTPPSYPYQLLMSTHPSDDYNGRSLRAWYKVYESRRSNAAQPAGVPLFLTDFNLDLFASPEEFLEVSLIDARIWGRMMGAFAATKTSGVKPIDVPLPWEVAADCDGTSSDAEVVKRVRSWLKTEDHMNLVRTKQKFDVDIGLKLAVTGLCN